ncbi:hypothetical protein ACFLYM_00115 [Chloroflexota bacterium]
MMTVKKFGILSVANISGVLSAIMGLIFGFFYAIFLTLVFAVSGDMDSVFSEFAGLGIGLIWLMGIIGFTVFYGIIGFLSGLIGAARYNVFAGWIGGIKVDLKADAEIEF